MSDLYTTSEKLKIIKIVFEEKSYAHQGYIHLIKI